jgi:hypothetical protein
MPHHDTPDPSKLQWRVDGPFERADDGRRLLVRETAGSELFGTVVAVGFMAGAAYGGWRLLQNDTTGPRVVGLLLLLAAAFLAAVMLRQLLGALGLINAPTRIPLVTFDRGNPGQSPAEIHFSGRRLPTADIRSLSTRRATVGSRHDLMRHIVVAELHDGTEVPLPLDNRPDWTAHYARQGAQWLNLPFRPGPG